MFTLSGTQYIVFFLSKKWLLINGNKRALYNIININYFCFILDTVLPRLHRTVVYYDKPTTGIDAI